MNSTQFLDLPELQPHSSGKNFYTATKPIKVFKKLDCSRIANLVIPQGATVWTESDLGGDYPSGKSRASIALCHSIVGDIVVKNGRTHQYTLVPSSGGYIKTSFQYYSDSKLAEFYLENPDFFNLKELKKKAGISSKGIILPHFFDRRNRQCAAGIHFFFNLKEAQNYFG